MSRARAAVVSRAGKRPTSSSGKGRVKSRMFAFSIAWSLHAGLVNIQISDTAVRNEIILFPHDPTGDIMSGYQSTFVIGINRLIFASIRGHLYISNADFFVSRAASSLKCLPWRAALFLKTTKSENNLVPSKCLQFTRGNLEFNFVEPPNLPSFSQRKPSCPATP